MKNPHYIFFVFGVLLFSVLAGLSVTIVTGNRLIAPVYRQLPSPPSKFEEVEFQSSSGAHIKGWYRHHEQAVASVMLLHGVRSDRREMQSRASFLYQQQMNVLLFDFQAHGESNGDAITFGDREARDAEAAFLFLHRRDGAVPIGAVGFSLGGAAVLLSKITQRLDFLILEAVYPDIETAIRNRLTMRFGKFGAILTPLLSWQLQWRLGIGPELLRPIAGLQDLRCPVFVIGGSEDPRTTLMDTRRLFDAARAPKSLWIVDGAKHENFHAFAPTEYERRVLAFISPARNQ